MIEIVEKKKCSGCTACMNICPKNAIEMEEDNEGFLYPKVDKSKCINCKLCEKVCPVLSKKTEKLSDFPKSYLGYEKNINDRINSASGGVFYSIAKNFIKKMNGVVVGAAFDNGFRVEHIIVDNIDDLKKLQKSKYVQSYLGDIFKEIEKILSLNKFVLFSGTPCQVASLKRYIKKKLQDNLYCIDLVCHGVPSPKVFKKYVEYHQGINEGIESIIPRDKKIYKRSYRTGYGIIYKNGNKYFEKHDNDPMARLFFSNISSRPICYDCPFKTIGRISDMTLGDCYFAHHFIKNFDDKYGINLLLIQTIKGEKMLDLVDSLYIYPVNSEEAIKINGGMLFESTNEPSNRELFFEELNKQKNIVELANEFNPIKKDNLVIKIKTSLVDNGLIPKKIIHKKKQKEIDRRLQKEIPIDSLKKYR